MDEEIAVVNIVQDIATRTEFNNWVNLNIMMKLGFKSSTTLGTTVSIGVIFIRYIEPIERVEDEVEMEVVHCHYQRSEVLVKRRLWQH